MTPYEFIGWTLNQASAVSAVTSTRIYHGLRARASALPAINYEELGGGTRFYGYERQPFTILCRANTPAAAIDLQRLVTTALAGADGIGLHGRNNGFTVDFSGLIQKQGLVPEDKVDGATVYNAPVDVAIVYPSATVS